MKDIYIACKKGLENNTITKENIQEYIDVLTNPSTIKTKLENLIK